MDLEKVFILSAFYLLTWVAVVYAHEAGHYITAKLCKLQITGFHIKKIFHIIPAPTAVYVDFSKKDLGNTKLLNFKYLATVAGGILAGCIPIIIFIHFTQSIMDIVYFGLIYLWMCNSDIKRLIQFIKGERIYDPITVNIPESEEECRSVYPKCVTCGYFIEKECPGDVKVFPTIYKPSDVERFRKIFNERYGDEK